MIRFILALITVAICGCQKEDSHPEVRDPIYKDLKAQADLHEKEVVEQQKLLDGFQLEIQKTEANSIDRKDARLKIEKAQASIKDHEQWAHFYKIRSARRAVVDKISAKEAQLANKPWPDPSEYSDYLVNKRLREVSLNWSARVPRLKDRLSKKSKVEEVDGTSETADERKPASGH